MTPQLPSMQITNVFPNQFTATPISTGKVLHDCLSLDLNGQPIGTLGSPTVVTLTSNALGLNGQSFVGSSGHLNLTLAGNARVVFSNPPGSGKTAAISAISIYYSGATAIYPTTFVNPTAGLPVKAGVVGNVLFGGALPQAYVMADTSATVSMSGGQTYVPLCAPQGRTVFSQLNLYVPPGYTFGVNLGMVASSDATIDFYWAEV